jgi:O-antigen/teichoic acid export membrane protein
VCSSDVSHKRWSEFKGLSFFSDWVVLVFSLFLTGSVIFMSFLIYKEPEENGMRQVLIVASFLIPLEAILSLQQSKLRGMDHIGRAMLPDMIIRPLLLVFGIVGIRYIANRMLNAQVAAGMGVAAAFVALAIGFIWLKRFTPIEVFESRQETSPRVWMGISIPLMLTQSLNLLLSQTSPIILGKLADASSVGFYSAAFQIAYLVNFFPLAISFVISPTMARLYVNGERVKLQQLLTQTVRLTIICGLGMTILYAVLGDFLLSLFGDVFIGARLTLWVLIAGNLISIFFGQTISLLTMTGFQKTVALILGFFSMINIGINFLLIPFLGHTGAAIATSSNLVISQFTLMLVIQKKLMLSPSIFKLKNVNSI